MASSVMASGTGLITGVPGIENDFKIYGMKTKTKQELYVYIAGPNGRCIPCRFEDCSDKNAIRVVYKPKEEGEHKVFIKFGGFQIKGSPFTVLIRGRAPFLTLEEKVKPYKYDDIHIFPLDIYNDVIRRSASSVRASGRGLKCGLIGVDNEIVVDARSAAPGRLSYSMTGPGNVDLENNDFSNGVYHLRYQPHSTGQYIVNIRYAERPILGSPFAVTVL